MTTTDAWSVGCCLPVRHRRLESSPQRPDLKHRFDAAGRRVCPQRGGAMFRALWKGALAGAAGTTALNAATYLDMAMRARPASGTPQQAVAQLGERTGRPVTGTGEERDNRLAGLGPLL